MKLLDMTFWESLSRNLPKYSKKQQKKQGLVECDFAIIVRGRPSGIPLPTVYILLSFRFAYILICYCLATALF